MYEVEVFSIDDIDLERRWPRLNAAVEACDEHGVAFNVDDCFFSLHRLEKDLTNVLVYYPNELDYQTAEIAQRAIQDRFGERAPVLQVYDLELRDSSNTVIWPRDENSIGALVDAILGYTDPERYFDLAFAVLNMKRLAYIAVANPLSWEKWFVHAMLLGYSLENARAARAMYHGVRSVMEGELR